MIAEVIFTGTELLLGQTLNTNALHLQQSLASLGLDLYYQVTVGDNRERCARAIREAAGRADLIFVGGGLGPTEDDVSREALSEALGIPLVRDEAALAVVRRFFDAGAIPMAANNLRQALVPAGGRALDNPAGTAPGILLEDQGRVFFLLPGPPVEFNRMLDELVIPFLRQRFPGRLGIIRSRVLKFCGIGESSLDEQLAGLLKSANPTVAPCAREGQIHLRLTAKAENEAEAEARIAEMEAAVRQRLGSYIFGADGETLPGVVGRLLAGAGQRVAVAEEFSGGLLAHLLTTDPVAREALACGVVVGGQPPGSQGTAPPPELFRPEGATLKEKAGRMAAAVRAFAGCEIGIAVLGAAVHPGRSDEKMTVCIATNLAGAGREKELQLWGDPSQAGRRAAQAALVLLWRSLSR